MLGAATGYFARLMNLLRERAVAPETATWSDIYDDDIEAHLAQYEEGPTAGPVPGDLNS